MSDRDMTPKIQLASCPTDEATADVVVENDRWLADVDIEKLVAECHAAAKQAVPDLARTVTVLFTDDAQLRALNLQFRGRDSATNVLSFPSGDGEAGFLGDIALAYETIMRESVSAGIALKDHTAHMVIHGLLHLAGFDHETRDDADQMETLEKEILSMLSISDPYEGEEPDFPAANSVEHEKFH